jgi:hypothetical protein
MTTLQTAPIRTAAATPTPWRLYCAVAAAPLFAVVSLTQAATRQGFDITRHPLSALSNGSLGWLQITNFLVTGTLLWFGAAGLRRAVDSRWTARLVRITAVGMFAAGIFRMDPMDGYPVGTPAGTPSTMSWHSILHMVSGSVAFTALQAACFVLGRYYARRGERSWAIASRTCGVVFILGDYWPMVGGVWGALTLAIGAITAMTWISVVAARSASS